MAETRLYFIPSVVWVLDQPQSVDDRQGPVRHYARSYYVVATDDKDAMELVRAEEERSGATLLDCESPISKREDLVAAEIGNRFAPGGRGVKWRSGRAFFRSH